MKLHAYILSLAVAILFCSNVLAQTQPPLSPVSLALNLKVAEAEGTALFLHDRAGSLAADALKKLKQFRRDRRLATALTEQLGDDSIRVTWIGGPQKQEMLALYRVVVSANGALSGEPVVLEPGEPLSESERQQAAARGRAMSASVELCTKGIKIVTLPSSGDNGPHWVVYLVPNAGNENAMMAGGSFRMDISQDGQSLLAKRGFTKTCFELPLHKKMVAAYTTHLLDPSPTSIQVFLSLRHNVPLYVATTENSYLWLVANGKINFVEALESK